jgi:hypothetical protein
LKGRVTEALSHSTYGRANNPLAGHRRNVTNSPFQGLGRKRK